jgi:hypothetical protein
MTSTMPGQIPKTWEPMVGLPASRSSRSTFLDFTACSSYFGMALCLFHTTFSAT